MVTRLREQFGVLVALIGAHKLPAAGVFLCLSFVLSPLSSFLSGIAGWLALGLVVRVVVQRVLRHRLVAREH